MTTHEYDVSANSTVDEDKYIVFNREQFVEAWNSYSPESGENEIRDAVVIRLQDVFAPTALNTYANTIMSFIELATSRVVFTVDELKHLQDLADFFAAKADQSTAMHRKLPD